MNKRGIIKIIEASVAILIVASVLFVNYNKGIVEKTPDYSENARDILEELASNSYMRDIVLDSGDVDSFVVGKLPPHLDFESRVCEIGEACGISVLPQGNIFSAERIISSNLDSYNPKKVRLFLWEKG